MTNPITLATATRFNQHARLAFSCIDGANYQVWGTTNLNSAPAWQPWSAPFKASAPAQNQTTWSGIISQTVPDWNWSTNVAPTLFLRLQALP